LGASTAEAQERAGLSVARSVRLALAGELVPDAVNVSGGVIAEDVRPSIGLVENLGRVFTALAGEVPVQFDVEVHGELIQHDVSVLRLAALKGLLTDVVEDPVSYVNAPMLAAGRGIDVRLLTDAHSPEFRNVITLSGTLADGGRVSVSGTLTGPKQVEKLVGIDGLDLELPLAEHMLVLRYRDRPGVIGAVGGLVGSAGVNIAAMQVARATEGGQAVGVLTLDQALDAGVLESIVTEIGAGSGRMIDLSD
jgi:D-3-phosphoglycerate dehydrogenase